MDACRLYQELYPTVDTLTAEGYARQIGILRSKYRVDQMELANKEEHSKLITGILTGSILLLLMFIVITIVLRRQRQKITLSTQRLERLRTDAENATSAKSIFSYFVNIRDIYTFKQSTSSESTIKIFQFR